MNRKIVPVILFFLIILSIIPLIFLPFGRDQEVAAYYGMSWIKGSWPYLGFYDWDGVGQMFVNAVLYWLFGNSVIVIRTFEILMLGLTVFFLYDLLKNKIRSGIWYVGVLYFVFIYMSLGYYHTGERDAFILFLLVFLMEITFGMKNNAEYLRSFLAGLFSSMVVFFRPTYGVFFILFIPVNYLNILKNNKSNFSIFIFSSLILPLLFLLIYYLKGGIEAFQLLYYNFVTLQRLIYPLFGGHAYLISNVLGHFSYVYPFILLNTLLILLIFNFRLSVSKFRTILYKYPLFIRIILYSTIVQVAYAMIVFIQGSFQYYQLMPLRVFTVLNTLVLSEIAFKEKKWRLPFFKLFSVMIFLSALAISPGFKDQTSNIINNYRIMFSILGRSETFNPDKPDYWPNAHVALADVIKKYTGNNDRIQLWAMDVGPYYYSDRITSTKFIWTTHLNIMDLPISTELYQQFLEEIEESPPKLFIVDNYDRIIGNPDRINDNINNYPEMVSILKNRYKLIKKIFLYDVYLRNNND